METNPDYDPTHKAASISSITSTSSAETAPSLYSGADAAESVYDVESPSLQPLDLHFGTGLDPTIVMPEHFAEPPPMMQDFFYPDAKLLSHDKVHLAPQTQEEAKQDAPPAAPLDRKRRASVTQEDDTEAGKRARELLTEDERRANHIASEQKRRNTIRTGFKDLTDIIPTLKNINNSKSTILFKAVEYIRHLEKRNRGLRDKLSSLQLRLEVQGRMAHLHGMRHTPRFGRPPARQSLFEPDSYPLRRGQVTKNHIPPEALAALVEHKHQEKQLAILREQLRIQQALLAKHNIPTPTAASLPIYAAPSQPPPPPPSSHASNYLTYNGMGSSSHRHTAAIVMPMHDDDDAWRRAVNAPSLNIPADEEFGAETEQRERLLSLNTNRQ